MWDKIKSITDARCLEALDSYGEMWLLPAPQIPSLSPSGWLVGKYKEQTRLATDLRTSAKLRQILTDSQVRFGLRESDRPPADVVRKKAYGSTVVGENSSKDFTAQRIQALATPVRPGAPPVNRLSDQEDNVAQFWATQTPQSHHIVEFNHLRDIGKSTRRGSGELDRGQLPCVLLMAEFHQRYISSILKKTHGWSQAELLAGLVKVYSDIYTMRTDLLRPLWEVSRIVLHAAGVQK